MGIDNREKITGDEGFVATKTGGQKSEVEVPNEVAEEGEGFENISCRDFLKSITDSVENIVGLNVHLVPDVTAKKGFTLSADYIGIESPSTKVVFKITCDPDGISDFGFNSVTFDERSFEVENEFVWNGPIIKKDINDSQETDAKMQGYQSQNEDEAFSSGINRILQSDLRVPKDLSTEFDEACHTMKQHLIKGRIKERPFKIADKVVRRAYEKRSKILEEALQR